MSFNTQKQQQRKCQRADTTQKKATYTCQYCDKIYSSKFYFDKHVESHKPNPNASVADGDATQDISYVEDASIHLDVSKNVSFSMLKDHTSLNVSSHQPFKKPAAPGKQRVTKPRAKPKFTCTYCLKGYVSNKSFLNHMRTHGIQDGAKRFPDKRSILDKSEAIAVHALTATANAPVAESTGQPFQQLVGEVISLSSTPQWMKFCQSLCELLVECIVDRKCLLPSTLLSSLMERLEILLSDDNLFIQFKDILPSPHQFEDDVKSQFVLEFGLNFVKETMKFISKTFRSDNRQHHQRALPDIDDEDREVIFYIGGSVLKGYFRIAYRYKSNKTYSLIVEVLKNNVLCDRPSHEKDAAWTRSVDRGGLLYPNAACQEFLVALTKIVFLHEKSDGSIDFEQVLADVSNGDIRIMWDAMISDGLPEQVSIGLMNDVVLCFCRTCGRGFAKRRLNLFRERPVVSMPTRHLVARRKQK